MEEDEKKPLETEESLDIFGQHRTDEELAAEAAAQKAQQKAERRAAYERAKEARKEANKEQRTTTIVMLAILGAIVVAIAVILILNLSPKTSGYDEAADSPHFYQTEALPDATDEGISGCINEAYYTVDGHLALKMTFTNGSETPQNLDALEVVVNNADGDKIAAGYVGKINGGDFLIPVNEYKELLFYFKPEHVQIKDDSLETLSYTITCTGTPIEAK